MDFDDDARGAVGLPTGPAHLRSPKAAWDWCRCRSITANRAKTFDQMSVRRGPVTLLSVVEGRDG